MDICIVSLASLASMSKSVLDGKYLSFPLKSDFCFSMMVDTDDAIPSVDHKFYIYKFEGSDKYDSPQLSRSFCVSGQRCYW